MVKGIDLEKHLASSGIAGAPTISHLRKKLRVANMLQCSGQGAAARKIVPADVTKFFLGLVAADQIKNAPAAIKLARASSHYSSRSENCDPWPFVGVLEQATLGEFLDALFTGSISSASEPGFCHWDMRFEFQIVSGDFRFFAKLIFEVGDESHVVQFLGLNKRIRTSLDSRQEYELPVPPHVDRVCIVRTKFLRDLIAFTMNAISDDTGKQDRVRPKVRSDNPFRNNGHNNVPSHPNRDCDQ
jgi:hypothetical protein